MNTLPYRPCVGIMLINSEGRIFTGERIDTPGAWQMPQGGIDRGEQAEDAAYRELEEEIGVAADRVSIIKQTSNWLYYDLPPHLMGKAWGGKYRGQKQLWFKMSLHTKDTAINIATEHPEFGRWQWLEPDQVIAHIVDFKKDIYQQVLNELL
ncbi:RNA pyrophosphohydrolase [Kordiimonas aquimaris]|uniref:RNA pyrophosphohydrolase n=1 Tax=Kordiimonas aquimaris TaxID=707591 RepID=UPI0021CE4024|nr:RNA pyrophosphohydrolase [Kordiimonas aquimaris]